MHLGRNDPCPCGNGKKYKNCCGNIKSSLQSLPVQTKVNITSQNISTKAFTTMQDEFNRLVALYNGGRYAELENRARLLVGRYPDYGLGWKLLSASLLMQDKDALLALQNAAKLLPHEAALHNNLGRAFTQHSRESEAEASFRRALEIKPDYPDAIFNLGGCLMDQGRLGEAETSYRELQKTKSGFIEGSFAIAQLRKVKAGDENLAGLIAVDEAVRCGATSLADKEAIFLHFALGKSYDDLGDHTKAFPHFIEGSRLKRAALDYDPGATTRHFDSIMSNFDASTISRLRDGGDPSHLPIFVLGMPRSGTTLTEQIIASHPEVHGAGELPDMMAIAQRSIAAANFPDNVRQLDQAKLAAWGAEYVAGLRRRAPDARCITDKMPANFQAIGLIHLMLPNAKIIHVNRNPVDTCLSCFTTLFKEGSLEYTYDLAELGRYYADYVRLMGHWRNVLPEGAFLDIQYEDIVADQEGQARRITEYCGLEWDEACLDFYKSQRVVRTASVTQVRQPIYKSSVERWRHYEKFLEPLLDALGDLAPAHTVNYANFP
jgi:tetratricopeptide (TPR) repeat protein